MLSLFRRRSFAAALRCGGFWLLAGCCSGTAIAEDPRATTRTLAVQGVSLTRGGQAVAVDTTIVSATSTAFSFEFLVPDRELTPILLTCHGITLDGLPPGDYALATLCTGGLSLQLGCGGDLCQTFQVARSDIQGALHVQTNVGRGFADTVKVDGETADFAATVDLPAVSAQAQNAPQNVRLALTAVAWSQHLRFANQPLVCQRQSPRGSTASRRPSPTKCSAKSVAVSSPPG